MNTQPTVIVLAESAPGEACLTLSRTIGSLNVLDSLLRRVLSSGLPMLLVAPAATCQLANALLPRNDILEFEVDADSPQEYLARSVAAGVQATAQSPGWLLLPATMPMLHVDTLKAVARALGEYPVVFPTYRHRRGYPGGFSAELFSELIRLEHERDLARLVARYPALTLDVDDPGIQFADLPQNTPASQPHRMLDARR